MIQLIRPIPKHLDAEHVQRLAAMSPELVRAHLDGYRIDRRDRTDRDDRHFLDKAIEAAQFVLSECEPFDVRIARERAEMDRTQFFLDQHRKIVAEHEAAMAEHRVALDELCLMAQQSEVVA